MMILSPLIGLFPALWPDWAKKLAAWATVAVAAVAILWGLKAAYDASVVEEHESKKLEASVEARDEAAEVRAEDTIRNSETERKLHDAIDKAPHGSGIDPAQLAANCERLREQPGGLSAKGRLICGD